MNPITLPIIITIAIVGIIAIILVKLFYKDKEASTLSDALPPIITSHWQESIESDSIEEEEEEKEENGEEEEESKEYGFVSKSWEEPMEQHNSEPDNGVATKVFQEPMHTRQQDLISNEYQKDSYIHVEHDVSNNDRLNDGSEEDFSNENPSRDNDIDSNDSNQMNDDHFSEYNTPKQYYSPNNEDYEHDHPDYESYENNEDYGNNKELEDNYYDNENDSLNVLGTLNMGEQVIIGGAPRSIKVGDEIIFNYYGESYSSRIFEIKHENIRVKYRGKQKWISFSDVKKVF